MNALAVLLTSFWMVLFVGENEGRKSERVVIENLLTAQPLPDGYESSLEEIKEDGKPAGYKLVFTKEGSLAKVTTTIEKQKRTSKARKIAALESYVDGTLNNLAGAGLKLVKKDLPDIKKVNVNQRFRASFVFQDDQDVIYLQMQIFFSDVGHYVLVLGSDEDDYQMLAKWAETIQPVKRGSKKAR